jgi:hypothetical protein
MVNESIPAWTGDVNGLEEKASLHGGSFGSQGGTLLSLFGLLIQKNHCYQLQSFRRRGCKLAADLEATVQEMQCTHQTLTRYASYTNSTVT